MTRILVKLDDELVNEARIEAIQRDETIAAVIERTLRLYFNGPAPTDPLPRWLVVMAAPARHTDYIEGAG